MALEGIRVVGPSGNRDRRGRRRDRDEGHGQKPFDDALKDKLELPDEEAEVAIEEDGREKSQRKQTSRWWRPDWRIDFTV